ncbi:sulfite exporter TauE/SafE family protein [Acuticoccus kandeliae]|uniref:sulfite exporter TauE/SafE family protein n=1 Tax=Acuticoccus kandeliae TaxID=2073160 RepID=UPI000D3E6544|nr:sulfite exporter TauE/SafE family protein [Acuticoccus kandeliae]
MDILAAGAVVLFGALVRGATGFGFALVSVPLLTIFWAPLFATGVALVLDLVASAVLLRSGVMRHLVQRDFILIGISGTIGAVIGAFAITELPARPAAIVLNAAVLLSAIAVLARVRWRGLDHPAAALLVGLLTGMLIGAFAFGGTLLVAWLIAVGRTPQQTRALLTIVFALFGSLALVIRLALGALAEGTLTWALFLAPITVLGILAGTYVLRFIHPEIWKRGVAVLLIAFAVTGLAGAAG